MHRIFLSVSSMIVAGFLLKSCRKLHEKPETREEIYRRMRAAHEARRATEMTVARMRASSTPSAVISPISELMAAVEQDAANGRLP